MKKRETDDYLKLLVKAYDRMKRKVDPESKDANRFLHYYHEALIQAGKDFMSDCKIYDFKRALDAKSLVDQFNVDRRILESFYVVDGISGNMEPSRITCIIQDLIEALTAAGWTEEKIKDHLNDPEGYLCQGDHRKKLTKEEEIFLFGEADFSDVDTRKEINNASNNDL